MSEVTTLDKRVIRSTAGDCAFVTRRVGSETIVVPIASRVGDLECVYTLNEVATRIWEELDAPHSAVQIAKVLALEYDAPVSDLVADVTAFIEVLEASGLVQSVPKAES